MNAETIRTLILTGLPDAQVEVIGDDGRHFQAIVVSPAFQGLMPVRRHQLVYAALGDAMKEAVHALSLATHTPSEWAARNAG
jgi:acid stress-induced BolA-like protein IbaG/YrbA